MYETYQTFHEYIKEYGLQRSEGLLLRYLSDVYKALVQSVPDPAKTEGVFEMIVYFGALVRGVDSSLLDEWESMRNVVRSRAAPATGEAEPSAAAAPRDLIADRRGFTALVRNEVFRFLRALSSRDYEGAAAVAPGPSGPHTPPEIERLAAAYFADYPGLPVDPAARHPRLTRIVEDDATWQIEQTIDDPEGNHDWVATFTVDLERAVAEGAPTLVLRSFASHGGFGGDEAASDEAASDEAAGGHGDIGRGGGRRSDIGRGGSERRGGGRR